MNVRWLAAAIVLVVWESPEGCEKWREKWDILVFRAAFKSHQFALWHSVTPETEP